MIKQLGRASAKAIDGMSVAMGTLSAVFLVLTACIVTYEVIVRALHKPTMWTFDVSIYLILAAMFLAAAYTAKESGHIHVDFLTSRLSAGTRSILEVITTAWTVLFCGVLLYSASKMLHDSIVYSRSAETYLGAPLAIPHGAFGLGLAVLTLQLIKITVQKIGSLSAAKDEAPVIPSFMSRVDKPYILIPIVVVLLAISTYFFSFEGGLRTVGLILMLLTILGTGTPVFAAVGMVGCVGLVFLLGGGLESQIQTGLLAYKPLSSFVIGAIPLFILGAGILSAGGLGEKLYDVCRKWFPPLRGKLAMATIGACAVFAAISGSSIANAAAFSLIAIPAMAALGYDKKLAYGAVAGGGTLGILIPPSGTFIMYGFLTGESVGRLFMAGVFPGIMLAILFCIYIFFRCRGDDRYQPDVTMGASWAERFNSLKGAVLILFAPILILGTIYLGLATPTEAAAIAVVYGLIITFISGKGKAQGLLKTLRDATKNGSMVLMILAGATIFGGVITILQIPQEFISFAVGANIPTWGVLGMMAILLIIMGMFMEGVAIIVIVLPIIYPAIIAMGLDPIWFGVVYVVIAEMGQLTPPVGMNLYAIRGVTGAKLEDIMKGSIPFLLVQLVALIIVAVYPPLSTWLPSTMMK
jgi:C4-dicarboxylate transporter DctM subunit